MLLVLHFAEAIVREDLDSECNRIKRCSRTGPAVRFPFRLRDHHPPHCGHPGFDLSCDQNKRTIMNLPRSAKLFVKKINYKSQQIEIFDPSNCLPRQLLNNPHLNISESPFEFFRDDFNHFYRNGYDDYGVFNCSLAIDDRTRDANFVPCLKNIVPGYGVRAVELPSTILELTGCWRIDVMLPSFPTYLYSTILFGDNLRLSWSEPNCSKCQGERRGCRLVKKTSDFTATTETECFHLRPIGGESKLLITGAILGFFFLILATIGLYHVHHSYKLKRKNEAKIKQILEDYISLKSTRYSYADIKSITNHFKEQLGKGAYGTVYKGTLSNNILVAVKILDNNSTGNGDEFTNEVASMGRIHHVNVARLVGYCADGPNRALVYEFLPNESLEKFIFSENDKRVVLGWEKLQDIALGIAKGMDYLHNGCDQQILHFDIKPHNILLDHNFVPKISDFGLAKLCSKDKSVVTMTMARGTTGYIAPEVASRNFGKPSYKSDVYSFGMLLLEMVGGKRNTDVNMENASQLYFSEWVYAHLDHLGGGMGIEIEEEEHAKIVKKLAIVALWCVQWHPSDRPSMKVVVQMLEGNGDNLTVPPNPFATGNPKIATKPSRPLNIDLEIISEAE